MYKVIEIFKSIDGEGKRAGEVTTFIRLSGCNLACAWCDTAYSQSGTCGIMTTLPEIINEVESLNCKNITLTGGEPLIHNEVDNLIMELITLGYDVNVETNGSVDPSKYILDEEYNNKLGKVWFTIDYKSKSSKMQDKMNIKHFINLRDEDVIKFVVGSKEELEDAAFFIASLESVLEHKPYIYFSPVFNMIEPVEIVNFMIGRNFSSKCRIQLQLHKIIWDPNTIGV